MRVKGLIVFPALEGWTKITFLLFNPLTHMSNRGRVGRGCQVRNEGLGELLFFLTPTLINPLKQTTALLDAVSPLFQLSACYDSFLISFKGNKNTKIKAKQMAECDAELAAVLFSRQEKISKDDQPIREADAIRKRSVRVYAQNVRIYA